MGKHRSGSARRRARRLRELEAELQNANARQGNGGFVIDMATSAMEAVKMLAAAAYDKQLEIKGDELACLFGMFISEIEAGRDLQKV